MVYKADTGWQDNGADIVGECQSSFQSPGQMVQMSRWIMARPLIRTTGNIAYHLSLDVDFSTSSLPTLDVTASASSQTVVGAWLSTTGIGYSAAPHIWIKRTADGTVELMNMQATFETSRSVV